VTTDSPAVKYKRLWSG